MDDASAKPCEGRLGCRTSSRWQDAILAAHPMSLEPTIHPKTPAPKHQHMNLIAATSDMASQNGTRASLLDEFLLSTSRIRWCRIILKSRSFQQAMGNEGKWKRTDRLGRRTRTWAAIGCLALGETGTNAA